MLESHNGPGDQVLWRPRKSFSSFSYWNHDLQPSQSDNKQRLVSWLGVAVQVGRHNQAFDNTALTRITLLSALVAFSQSFEQFIADPSSLCLCRCTKPLQTMMSKLHVSPAMAVVMPPYLKLLSARQRKSLHMGRTFKC